MLGSFRSTTTESTFASSAFCGASSKRSVIPIGMNPASSRRCASSSRKAESSSIMNIRWAIAVLQSRSIRIFYANKGRSDAPNCLFTNVEVILFRFISVNICANYSIGCVLISSKIFYKTSNEGISFTALYSEKEQPCQNQSFTTGHHAQRVL